LINQLCGNTNQADLRYTGLNAAVAPDGAHQIAANGKTLATVTLSEAGMVAGDRFTIDLLLDAVYIAHTNTMPIKPIRLNGLEINGVMILHPTQVRSLKKNYSLGQWGDIQKAAMNGGQITGNPIFIGSIGMIEGVVMHEDAMVPYGSGAGTGSDATAGRNLLGVANVARGVFCGAQAACMASGRAYDSPNKFKWFEELLDAGNQLRVMAGKIYGIKKNVFNSQDYATVTISSFES
jgi:N4-gp56 family major capsid protein